MTTGREGGADAVSAAIPATEPAPVVAAGALCWKIVDGKVKVLVVHRTQHRDVSLPKGKIDPGETLPECAVREIAEETGLTIALGAPLSTVEYRLPNGRRKIVYYWLAEVGQLAIANSTFVSNEEIEALEWMSLKRAKRSLSYPHDVQLIDEFTERLEQGTHRTFALIAVRHAKAVPREHWEGTDASRPLLPRGVEQALSIAHGIAAYRPARLVSSTAARCAATMEQLARVTASEVKFSDGISQDAWTRGESDVERTVRKRMSRQQTAVLCSHGPVLPEIVEVIARETGTAIDDRLRRAASLAPGEFAVFHIAVESPEGGLVAVETHSPTA